MIVQGVFLLVLCMGWMVAYPQECRDEKTQNLTATTSQSVHIPAFSDLSTYTSGVMTCTFYGRSGKIDILRYRVDSQNTTFTDSYKDRTYVSISDGSIHIKNLSKEDEGDYECILKPDMRHACVRLQIQDAVSTPSITNSSLNRSNIIPQNNTSQDSHWVVPLFVPFTVMAAVVVVVVLVVSLVYFINDEYNMTDFSSDQNMGFSGTHKRTLK
ncbi:uncharacterized protein LOC115474996 [Microcaecilia unicolor]|uniref:Uncharacterized protein LOC115474996 n=1 Tax=Microcaecilia unicolor TaxID=1415580 RepID=A0A6P7YGN5_9AMPH|nr:uncharacterized protein LOC115474996 [Microcaecilia unicolor]